MESSSKTSVLNFKKNALEIMSLIACAIGTYIFFIACQNTERFIDDNLLLGPILKMDNFFLDYSVSKSWDIQPVRDLSYFIDLKLSKLINLETFLYTNLLIHVLTTLFIFKILLLGNGEKRFNALFAVGYYIHPIHSFILPWISSRKYLLANFFVLISYYSYQKAKNTNIPRNIFTATTSIFAMLSHSTALLYPFWLASREFKRTQKNYLQAYLSLAAILLLYLNSVKYLGNKATLGNSLAIPLQRKIQIVFLSVSRHIFNILIPLDLTFYYSEHSLKTLISIPVFIVFVLLIRKYKISPTYPIFAPLLLVSIPVPFYHVINAYSLQSLAWFIIVLSPLCLKGKNIIDLKFFFFFTLTIYSFFIYSSYRNTRLWSDHRELLNENVLFEKNEFALALLMQDRISKAKSLRQSVDYAIGINQRFPEYSHLTSPFLFLLLFKYINSNEYTQTEKENRISLLESTTEGKFFLCIIRENRASSSCSCLKGLNQDIIARKFFNQEQLVKSIFKKVCKNDN